MQLKHLLAILIAACLLTPAPKGRAQTAQNSAAVAQQSVADRAADLEEQLIDLQVRIATMRSLAANAIPAVGRIAPQQAFQGSQPVANSQQVAALEAEVQALSEEAHKLSGRPSLILPTATVAHRPAPDNSSPATITSRPTTQQQGSTPGWAGSTTVLPRNGPRNGPSTGPFPESSQGRKLPSEQSAALPGELLPGSVYPGYENVQRRGALPQGQGALPQDNSRADWAKPNSPAQVARETPTNNAETEYQTAYGYLLQQDYGAAQTAFSEFLKRYPNTPLAGNAQYWIGETHYVRGAYKNAAVAFLRGYEKYGDGNKGPDSLLKLAFSLGKLRQTAAACSSLRELGKRYRSAPQPLLTRATAEMRRLRCPN